MCKVLELPAPLIFKSCPAFVAGLLGGCCPRDCVQRQPTNNFISDQCATEALDCRKVQDSHVFDGRKYQSKHLRMSDGQRQKLGVVVG